MKGSITAHQYVDRDRLSSRIMSKVEKRPDGCWQWSGQAYGSRLKYGYIKIVGKLLRVHRVMFELFVGPIVNDLFVLHSCDNSLCVNPDHLHLGTQKRNREEAVERGRTAKGGQHGRSTVPERTARGEDHGRAKLARRKVQEAKLRFVGGVTCKQLASDYGVHPSTMADALCGKTWRNVEVEA